MELALASDSDVSNHLNTTEPKQLQRVRLHGSLSLNSFRALTVQDGLSRILEWLQPAGEICGQLSLADEPEQTLTQFERDLVLAGFTHVKLELVTQESSSSGESSRVLQVSAKRPEYSVGSSVSLSKAASAPISQSTTKSEGAKVWKLQAADLDLAEDDLGSDLIDADALLTEEDRMRPTPQTGCAQVSGPKRACKNCTCGLAQQLDAESRAAATSQSACGSCYLGDAFRCSGCPYRGLPPFKPGERVTIPTDDHTLAS